MENSSKEDKPDKDEQDGEKERKNEYNHPRKYLMIKIKKDPEPTPSTSRDALQEDQVDPHLINSILAKCDEINSYKHKLFMRRFWQQRPDSSGIHSTEENSGSNSTSSSNSPVSSTPNQSHVSSTTGSKNKHLKPSFQLSEPKFEATSNSNCCTACAQSTSSSASSTSAPTQHLLPKQTPSYAGSGKNYHQNQRPQASSSLSFLAAAGNKTNASEKSKKREVEIAYILASMSGKSLSTHPSANLTLSPPTEPAFPSFARGSSSEEPNRCASETAPNHQNYRNQPAVSISGARSAISTATYNPFAPNIESIPRIQELPEIETADVRHENVDGDRSYELRIPESRPQCHICEDADDEYEEDEDSFPLFLFHGQTPAAFYLEPRFRFAGELSAFYPIPIFNCPGIDFHVLVHSPIIPRHQKIIQRQIQQHYRELAFKSNQAQRRCTANILNTILSNPTDFILYEPDEQGVLRMRLRFKHVTQLVDGAQPNRVYLRSFPGPPKTRKRRRSSSDTPNAEIPVNYQMPAPAVQANLELNLSAPRQILVPNNINGVMSYSARQSSKEVLVGRRQNLELQELSQKVEQYLQIGEQKATNLEDGTSNCAQDLSKNGEKLVQRDQATVQRELNSAVNQESAPTGNNLVGLAQDFTQHQNKSMARTPQPVQTSRAVLPQHILQAHKVILNSLLRRRQEMVNNGHVPDGQHGVQRETTLPGEQSQYTYSRRPQPFQRQPDPLLNWTLHGPEHPRRPRLSIPDTRWRPEVLQQPIIPDPRWNLRGPELVQPSIPDPRWSQTGPEIQTPNVQDPRWSQRGPELWHRPNMPEPNWGQSHSESQAPQVPVPRWSQSGPEQPQTAINRKWSLYGPELLHSPNVPDQRMRQGNPELNQASEIPDTRWNQRRPELPQTPYVPNQTTSYSDHCQNVGGHIGFDSHNNNHQNSASTSPQYHFANLPPFKSPLSAKEFAAFEAEKEKYKARHQENEGRVEAAEPEPEPQLEPELEMQVEVIDPTLGDCILRHYENCVKCKMILEKFRLSRENGEFGQSSRNFFANALPPNIPMPAHHRGYVTATVYPPTGPANPYFDLRRHYPHPGLSNPQSSSGAAPMVTGQHVPRQAAQRKPKNRKDAPTTPKTRKTPTPRKPRAKATKPKLKAENQQQQFSFDNSTSPRSEGRREAIREQIQSQTVPAASSSRSFLAGSSVSTSHHFLTPSTVISWTGSTRPDQQRYHQVLAAPLAPLELVEPWVTAVPSTLNMINMRANGTSGSHSTSGNVIQHSGSSSQSAEEPMDQVLDLRKSSNFPGKPCIWCKQNTLCNTPENGIGTEFCSEVCFDLFRRDSFKKRATCIWCNNNNSGSGHGHVNINLTSNLDESKFCSDTCLTQFKVRLFCEETSAHLDQIKDTKIGLSTIANVTSSQNYGGKARDLITPDLWLKKSPNGLNTVNRNADSNERKSPSSSTSSVESALLSPTRTLILSNLSHDDGPLSSSLSSSSPSARCVATPVSSTRASSVPLSALPSRRPSCHHNRGDDNDTPATVRHLRKCRVRSPSPPRKRIKIFSGSRIFQSPSNSIIASSSIKNTFMSTHSSNNGCSRRKHRPKSPSNLSSLLAPSTSTTMPGHIQVIRTCESIFDHSEPVISTASNTTVDAPVEIQIQTPQEIILPDLNRLISQSTTRPPSNQANSSHNSLKNRLFGSNLFEAFLPKAVIFLPFPVPFPIPLPILCDRNMLKRLNNDMATGNQSKGGDDDEKGGCNNVNSKIEQGKSCNRRLDILDDVD